MLLNNFSVCNRWAELGVRHLWKSQFNWSREQWTMPPPPAEAFKVKLIPSEFCFQDFLCNCYHHLQRTIARPMFERHLYNNIE